MQRQNYMITAEEVAESMEISLGYAYKLLRKLNKELADQGWKIWNVTKAVLKITQISKVSVSVIDWETE